MGRRPGWDVTIAEGREGSKWRRESLGPSMIKLKNVRESKLKKGPWQPK